MKKAILIVLVLGLLLCLCSCASNSDNKFVGTWKCDEWIDFGGDVEKNAKIVLKSDGSGTIQRGERWATFRLTWEKLDEDTIMIYEENYSGGSTGSEYSYEIIDGIPYLKFDNGSVTRNFYKQ